MRFFYAAVGLALIAGGLLWLEEGFWHKAVPIAGGFILVEGLIGYSLVARAFGAGGQK